MALSGTQNLLNGVTFPTFGISGANNITNEVTVPSIPSASGVSVDTLKQNVPVPTVPTVSVPV